jgi:hypothetical protein
MEEAIEAGARPRFFDVSGEKRPKLLGSGASVFYLASIPINDRKLHGAVGPASHGGPPGIGFVGVVDLVNDFHEIRSLVGLAGETDGIVRKKPLESRDMNHFVDRPGVPVA